MRRAFSASACAAAIDACRRASASKTSALRRRLGLLLHLVAGGVGGLAHLGVELALLQRGLPDGDLLLLGQDRLVAVGLGERAGGGGLGGGGVGLGLDLGLLQRQRALGDRDLLLGLDPGLLGGRRASASAIAAVCPTRAASGRPRSAR